MFDADKDLHDEEVFVAQQYENVVEKEVDVAQVQVTTAAITLTISIDEVSLAQELAELKHIKSKAKAKGIIFHEPEESTITTTTTIPKPKAKKIEEPDDVQANIDADFQLAERLKPKRKVTKVPQPSEPTEHVEDDAVNKKMDDSLEKAATTATSLDAEHDRETSSGGGPKCQEAIRDTAAHIRVLYLETTKSIQAHEINSLKRRVKKLEKKQRSRTHKHKRLYKLGLSIRVESSDDEGLGEEDV
nr:hypothetical protein [Tanacetum cinerariifolium]